MHIYSACRGVNVHFCQGYIAAIADEMNGGIEFRRYRACIPEEITILQLRLVVSKWMSEHQQYRHDPAAGLVAEALAAAFPCSFR
ncbi:MAG: Rap1a/Tai family immunity protein [Alphaproteobacteria bacterium]